MKKLFTGMMCVAMCGVAVLGAAACGDDDRSRGHGTTFSLYAPDGAPALALANLLDGEKSAVDGDNFDFDVHVVNATTIQTYVAGETPKADFCILPVNAAGMLLGTGATYQMLGTVTNGNLYFLKDGTKELPDLTAENIAEALQGKIMGVIQNEQVPGLTLRVVLQKYNVPYEDAAEGGPQAADKLTLAPCTPEQVVPPTGYDYYLCPEPAATTKIGATQGKLAAAGSLQTLYGGENGYPQAVLVAKNSVISENKAAVEKVVSYMQGAAQYLQTAEAATLSELLAEKRTAGMEAAFSEAQLNPTVLANCSVRFTKAADCKQAVKEFLTKFNEVKAGVTKVPEDGFFYAG